jgi:hypothetical protein
VNTAEILNKAADVIDERGWTQGEYENCAGGVCARGAIFVAVGLNPLAAAFGSDSAACSDAEYTSVRFRNWLGVMISGWNDDSGRTPEQVTSALRECAAALAGGAS